ncbi:protein NRT1/ PTR FAMILY 1.2-like [Coffea eugenioides]|uniref:protein NRT1/ PTR FAMILY 1.2-like n=1 Tax=Coffea eugenioides TaxID=49369 RepID=UPI000F608B9B|nr:protein NRT1/ PTR FAMILY 1.2-like [Coffea eugenioides]
MGMEMESYSSNTGAMDKKEKLSTTRRKGGLVTMPFIIANEAFEKVASYGVLPNMIFYLMKGYNLSFAKANYVLFLWSAATNFTPTLGAFLADSYLGRFLTISLGCIFSLLGMTVLWLTAMIPGAKPQSCNLIPPCKSATAGQLGLLISSFGLMSIGAGGIRSASMAFGADQLDNKDNPDNERVQESYFGWYYAATSISVLVAFTGIVYIQDKMGMKVGFGVPAILMFLSALLFFLASSFYIKHKATKSLLTGLVQVTVAAYKNRKLALPPLDSSSYHHRKGSRNTGPTEKLMFLNKACVLRNPEDVTPSGVALDPWSLCTVEQVEELKALIRVIPIWSTGIMMSINTSQSSFPVIQASSMNRHVTSNFQIPAGSFVMFMMITISGWLVLYDRAILPLASKIRGKPVRIGTKARMGIGLFFTGLSMVISGVVERVRRRKAIEQGFLNDPQALVDMSAMWLVPQYVAGGFAEAFNAIGQIEFYYSEFPRTMSSVASSLFGLGMAVANVLASAVLSTVDRYTKGEGKESWVSSNINKGRYENYYWLLSILSCVNLICFIICSWAYGPCADDVKKEDDIEGNELEEISKLRPRTPLRVMPA